MNKEVFLVVRDCGSEGKEVDEFDSIDEVFKDAYLFYGCSVKFYKATPLELTLKESET